MSLLFLFTSGVDQLEQFVTLFLYNITNALVCFDHGAYGLSAYVNVGVREDSGTQVFQLSRHSTLEPRILGSGPDRQRCDA